MPTTVRLLNDSQLRALRSVDDDTHGIDEAWTVSTMTGPMLADLVRRGYIEVEATPGRSDSVTWYRLTATGRDALRAAAGKRREP